MKLSIAILLCALQILSSARASEVDLAEKMTSCIASMVAADMRTDVRQRVNGGKLTGPNQSTLIAQISRDIASCHVNARLELAKAHSIDIADIFDVVRCSFHSEMFSDKEINESTNNCARDAFENAGIPYD